tara:strand:+ start:863 stop:1138 length:276 start_codon:yes stop_codon:yes gene_type:complete
VNFPCILSTFEDISGLNNRCLFNQRKNKRFTYKPRFQDSDEKESKDDFETKWNKAKESNKRRGNIFTSLPALIIMLVSLFVLMYILEGYIK